MGLGISPPTLNALVRIAERIGELYGGPHRDELWTFVDALVANGCQCAIFVCGGLSYGYLFQDEKIFYDSTVQQGVLFQDALELLGPF